MDEDGNDDQENDEMTRCRKESNKQLSSVSEAALMAASKPGLTSLLSNDSGFKSEAHTASSSSSSSSSSDKETSHNNDVHRMNGAGASNESVPIMVDCHSGTSVGATSGAVANEEEGERTSGQTEGTKREQLACEIKPIPIKKALGELAEEEKLLADGLSNFKPTGAVFKLINNKENIQSGKLIF